MVSRDFRLTTLSTKAGRTVSGFVVSENDNALTVQSLAERIVIPSAEVSERRELSVSMMPEGLLRTMSEAEVRDLIAYLSGSEQVPLPETDKP